MKLKTESKLDKKGDIALISVEKERYRIMKQKIKLEIIEFLFLQAFLDSIKGETFVKDMSVAEDKRQQFNVRIPKGFLETVKIDIKKDKFVFKLDVPPLKSGKKPKLTAELIKDWDRIDKTAIGLNKITKREEIGVLAKGALSRIQNKEGSFNIPFNTSELTILKVLVQKRKSANAQEIASATDLTWPTINKYLNVLKKKGLVKITEKGPKKRTRWEYNRGYIERLKLKIKKKREEYNI